MGTPERRRKSQVCLTVDLGVKLLAAMESMRREVQDADGVVGAISRGDVVRLALRLLLLRILDLQATRGDGSSTAIAEWSVVAGDLILDPHVPTWAKPGEQDTPRARAGRGKKGGGK